MKHLKIESLKGYFKRGESWVEVTDMTKEDLLILAHAAIEDENFELDAFNEAFLPNPAHRIIYQQVCNQLSDLHERRVSFLEEARCVYKDAWNKYCSD